MAKEICNQILTQIILGDLPRPWVVEVTFADLHVVKYRKNTEKEAQAFADIEGRRNPVKGPYYLSRKSKDFAKWENFGLMLSWASKQAGFVQLVEEMYPTYDVLFKQLNPDTLTSLVLQYLESI